MNNHARRQTPSIPLQTTTKTQTHPRPPPPARAAAEVRHVHRDGAQAPVRVGPLVVVQKAAAVAVLPLRQAAAGGRGHRAGGLELEEGDGEVDLAGVSLQVLLRLDPLPQLVAALLGLLLMRGGCGCGWEGFVVSRQRSSSPVNLISSPQETNRTPLPRTTSRRRLAASLEPSVASRYCPAMMVSVIWRRKERLSASAPSVCMSGSSRKVMHLRGLLVAGWVRWACGEWVGASSM